MTYIYFGTSEFAATILEKLLDANMAPVAIVTQPDRPAGRGEKLQISPVKTVAQKYGVPLLQPQKISDCRFQITDLKPDVCVIAAYGGIIPQEVLKIPKHGFVNVHPSLLPKYRGPSPIQTAMLNGDKETGVSIMVLDETVDHGPVIIDYRLQITDLMTAPELERELAILGAKLLIKTTSAFIAGKIVPIPQNHTKATLTKMLTKEDGHIDWTQSAEQIERHVRAMTPWPGSWTVWEHKQKKMLLRIKKSSVMTESSRLRSNNTTMTGAVVGLASDAMIVGCGNGVLAIHEIQPEGKKIMPASAFVNGHRSIIGSVLT